MRLSQSVNTISVHCPSTLSETVNNEVMISLQAVSLFSHGDEGFPLCPTPSGLFSLHCWDATGLFMLSAGIALIRAQYHAAFLVAVKKTWVRATVTLWHYHEFLTLCELSMCLWVQDCWTLTSCWYFTLDDVGQLFWRHHQSYNLVPATIVGFPLAKRTPYVSFWDYKWTGLPDKRRVSQPVTSVSS